MLNPWHVRVIKEFFHCVCLADSFVFRHRNSISPVVCVPWDISSVFTIFCFYCLTCPSGNLLCTYAVEPSSKDLGKVYGPLSSDTWNQKGFTPWASWVTHSFRSPESEKAVKFYGSSSSVFALLSASCFSDNSPLSYLVFSQGFGQRLCSCFGFFTFLKLTYMWHLKEKGSWIK